MKTHRNLAPPRSSSTPPFPQGQDFQLASYLYPSSPLSYMPSSAANVMHVNAFSIDYRPDGSVAQFYSDLSLTDPRDGRELLRKTISVNDPFRYGVSPHHTRRPAPAALRSLSWCTVHQCAKRALARAARRTRQRTCAHGCAGRAACCPYKYALMYRYVRAVRRASRCTRRTGRCPP